MRASFALRPRRTGGSFRTDIALWPRWTEIALRPGRACETLRASFALRSRWTGGRLPPAPEDLPDPAARLLPLGLVVKALPGTAAPALRVVTGEKTVACGEDETLISVVCSSGAPDGAGCPSATQTTGVCMHK